MASFQLPIVYQLILSTDYKKYSCTKNSLKLKQQLKSDFER